MKAVIYARYSSDRQREASIEQQIDKCRLYAAAESIEIVSEYTDEALTGRNANRPGFQKMIADAKGKTFDTVLVYSLDRFSRDKYEAVVYKHELKQHGIRVISATEPISDDPAGILIEGVFESLAMYYSAELSMKIHRGLEYNAQKFLANGRCCYGYDRGPDGRYVINEDEATIVREIFRRVHAQEKISDIAASLNDRQIHTKTGGKWTKTSFEKLLSNERYIGTYIWKDQKTEDAIPAIIDKNLFLAVQKYISTKANPKNGRRRTDYGLYLLSGKLICSKCGKPMVGVSGTGRNGKLYFYYSCHDKHMKIPRDKIETIIAKAMRKLCLSDDCVRWMARNSFLQHQKIFQGPTLEDVSNRLAESKQSQKNILKAIENGVSTDMMLARMQELEKEINDLQGFEAEMKLSAEEITSEEDIISYLQLFREGDIEDKITQQHLLDAFVIKAEVFVSHIRVYFAIKQENRQVDIPLSGTEPDGAGSFKDTWWSDWIMLLAIEISNAVDFQQDREDLFNAIQQKYSQDERQRFCDLAGMYFEMIEEEPFQDLLGSLYMELGFGNRKTGQFFTPYHISELLSEIQGNERIIDELSHKEYITANDPTCGGGSLLIALAEKLLKMGINYQERCLFVGQELDIVTACSAYIQFSMIGMPGVVICGDTLKEPLTENPLSIQSAQNVWKTPLYFGEVWKCRRLENVMKGLIDSDRQRRSDRSSCPKIG